MKKTIGPVNMNHSFMVHNSKGFPCGITVIAFNRPGDAMRSREMYNGKVIDGSKWLILEFGV